MRYNIISSLAAAGIVILTGCQESDNPPNVILIMSDDQGYGDFGFTGNQVVETPVLDQFRQEAALFDRFYVSPVCAPTRASLMTGRYHLRTGTTWVTHGKEVMRSEEKTIAESFLENGYATGCFGKWHNGEHFPHNPNGQGFETFFGFSSGHWNNYFDTHLEYNGREVPTEGYITDILTDSSLAFIEKNREKPFFCYIPYNAPHGPFQVPEEYFKKYKEKGMDDKNAAVYGMCENIDYNVGRILQKLDDLNLTGNTIVIYLTDNGPNGARYNAGMKGIKGDVDEGGVRSPLMIRYPGVVPPGSTVNGLSSHIDLLPTINALCGINFSVNYPLDGIDLSAYLKKGDTIPERLIFTHQVQKELHPSPVSVRSSEFRLVILPGGDTSLYNMIRDPGQVKDIYGTEAEVSRLLIDTINSWYSDVTSNLPYTAPIPIGYKSSPITRLPAPEASMTGSVAFKGGFGWANDWLTGFAKGENRATWNLMATGNNTYDVFIRYACNDYARGETIKLVAGGESLTHSIPGETIAELVESPDRVDRGEVYEREWPIRYIGAINLNKGEEQVSLSFSGSSNSELEIKELILKMKI